MIFKDAEGDSWRYSASRGWIEVSLTGTGETEADLEWDNLSRWANGGEYSSTKSIADAGEQRFLEDYPHNEQVFADCRANPEP